MENKKWVAGWGAAVSTVSENHTDYVKDQTFRYVIFPTIDGEALRLHFSNQFGKEKAVITKIYVAKCLHDEHIKPETSVQITFGGKPSVSLPAGGGAVSDEIPFSFKAGEQFSVSMYFGKLTQIVTGHSNNGPYIKKFYGKGDWADKETIPDEFYGENGPYVFLHTIDFLTNPDCHAIVAFGDSITAQPWPDCLAHRIFDSGIRNASVIRKAIGGSRMLREYSYRFRCHYGIAGIRRFESDICQAGVDRVFILHGINDLYHPQPTGRWSKMNELPTAEEMIENGYKKYIEIAHKHGIKIYISPILPCAKLGPFEGNREEIRQRVNEWIRTEADIDGVIDFESAVWNPENHLEYFSEYDSGDHLHPSLAGAEHMAQSIPEEFIR